MIKKIIFFIGFYLVSYSNNGTLQRFRELEKTENIDEKIQLLNKIKLEYNTLSDSLKIEYLYNDGIIKMRLGKLEDAKNKYYQAIKEFGKQKNLEKLYLCKINLSHIFIKQNLYEKSLNILYSLNNLNVKDKSELHITYAALLTNIDFGKSNYYNKIGLKEAYRNKNIKSIIKCYNLFATNYYQNKNIKKAIYFSNKALHLSLKYNFKITTLYLYTNLAAYNNILKNYQLSNHYIDKAEILNEPLIDSSIKYNLLLHKALNNFDSNNLKESYKNVLDFISTSNKNSNKYLLSSIYLIQGKIFKRKKDYQNAIHSLIKAIKLSQSESNIIDETDGHKLISEVYKINNNFKDAYTHITHYYELIKQHELDKTKEELNLQELKYKISNFQKELKYKNQKIDLLNLKNTNNNYQIIVLTIFIISLFFFLYKQKKINQISKKNTIYLKEISRLKEDQLENKISFTSNQILEFAIQIQDQNQILQELKNKISIFIKNNKKTKFINEIQNLLFDINNALEMNHEKIKLNTEINNATDNFLYNIKDKYPDLIDKEIQIITYIRLNYKTKQIASLMSISGQSVNNYRASIRKKMKISRTINLYKYLNEL